MKKAMVPLIVLLFLFSVPALAKNQDSHGSMKNSTKQKEVRKEMKAAKENASGEMDEEKEKITGELNEEKEKNEAPETEEEMGSPGDQLRGLDKQREKKSEQVQKELDKGSEQGQESRQHRKKWWKFWGE